ncbi:MAG: hypothetical protein IKQ48_07215 [Paludibacteraceae bacterium]|nr:hypothetical protein [Paludibacteraceae bacterium]
MRTKSYNDSGLTAKRSYCISGLTAILMAVAALLLPSCNPEAEYETKNVKVKMEIKTVSSGFVECDFSTDKGAYYLIGIIEPWENFNPMYNQKQFMQLVLDYAYAEYLVWRNDLLIRKEFNVASFASHSIQYGSVHHFFTGLVPNHDYWLYAFAVNPETMQPISNLQLENVLTKEESIMDIHFEYRVMGEWDYVYPVDTNGNLNSHFPYIAITYDSLTLSQDSDFLEVLDYVEDTVADTTLAATAYYFAAWAAECFLEPEKAKVRYGVHAVKNDGIHSDDAWEEGHTYYTALSGYDGSFRQTTIYRFVWTGDSCNLYFKDTDPANIINILSEEE